MYLDTGEIDWSDPFEPDAPLNQGLAAWWLAGGDNPWWGGPKFLDLVPQRNEAGGAHGTLTNGPTWQGARGRPGGWGSLGLNGSNYVNLGDPAGLAFTTGNFTLAAWVRVTAKSPNGIVAGILGRSTNGSPVVRVLGIDVTPTAVSGQAHPQIQLYDGSNNPFARHAASIGGAGWTHVCGVRESGLLKLYVNGVFSAQATDTAGDVSGSNQVWSFGRQAYTDFAEPLQGDVDDGRVYSRALSAADVAALYAESRQGYPACLRRVRRAAWSVPAAPGGGVPLGTLALLGCGR